MALIVHTNRPRALMNAIIEGIESGDIETWSADDSGHLRHSTPSGQWENEAHVEPTVIAGEMIIFSISGPEKDKLQTRVYAVYLGRLAEMLLAHFDKSFSSINITALAEPELGDEV